MGCLRGLHDQQVHACFGVFRSVRQAGRHGVQAGYYCSVCDCILRDSMSYLDHINGKYHNRALGMNMRVERSTADQARPLARRWCCEGRGCCPQAATAARMPHGCAMRQVRVGAAPEAASW